ncbi:MAG: hypothetical protein MI924_39040 [Chloroflexales bacterium]|nr:hypothetical protein [Chloroflexales bacterium]
MSDNATLITHLSDQRYIARCQHGTLHLVWDQMILRLQPIDVLRLAHMLDQLHTQPQQQLFQAGPLWLWRSLQGAVQLGMGMGCLAFTPSDFRLFAKMATMMIEHCAGEPAKSRPTVAPPVEPNGLWRTGAPGEYFSQN